jgi:hypothetical protein
VDSLGRKYAKNMQEKNGRNFYEKTERGATQQGKPFFYWHIRGLDSSNNLRGLKKYSKTIILP